MSQGVRPKVAAKLPKSRWRWRRAPDRPCRGPGRVGHERLRRPPRPSHTCKYPSGRPCIPPRAVVARRQVLRPDLGRRASGTLRGPFFPNRNVYSEGPPAARRGTGPVAAGASIRAPRPGVPQRRPREPCTRPPGRMVAKSRPPLERRWTLSYGTPARTARFGPLEPLLCYERVAT